VSLSLSTLDITATRLFDHSALTLSKLSVTRSHLFLALVKANNINSRTRKWSPWKNNST
jgi:hypothetical protein